MAKLTDARIKANKKWDEKNKERKQYIVARSQAKRFISKFATEEDLDTMQEYIEQRRTEIKNVNK